MKADAIFSDFVGISITRDNEDLEPCLACKYPDCVILISNFRKININYFSSDTLCLNFHNSKLPDYKGIHPVPWQIRDGASVIWLSVHIVTIDLDSGPIVLRTRVKRMKFDDVISITKKLEGETYRLVRILANMITSNNLNLENIKRRNNFQPVLAIQRRPWARRLLVSDNLYSVSDSNSYCDFIDSTPYPFNTHHE